MKRCSTCGEYKDENQFTRNRRAPDGLQWGCRACSNAAKKKWQAQHPEKNAEYVRRHYAKKPDGYYSQTLKKYGLTLEDYHALVEQQDGLCLVCNVAPEEGERLVVDHCHKKGHVRGLLCQRCNRSIGSFQDDPDLLRAAASYLESSQSATVKGEVN
jgi:hypothetical protein